MANNLKEEDLLTESEVAEALRKAYEYQFKLQPDEFTASMVRDIFNLTNNPAVRWINDRIEAGLVVKHRQVMLKQNEYYRSVWAYKVVEGVSWQELAEGKPRKKTPA